MAIGGVAGRRRRRVASQEGERGGRHPALQQQEQPPEARQLIVKPLRRLCEPGVGAAGTVIRIRAGLAAVGIL